MDLTPFDEAALMAEVSAEIEKAAQKGRQRELVIDPAQTRALMAMRGAGMSWPGIMKFWRRKGWPGCPNTLRRIYREAMGDAPEA